jgi:LmbE family N-acetylglucosaminyl deacetylase
MLPLRLPNKSGPLEVLCIGAHSDDIEIGCAATLLGLVERGHRLRVTWVVLSAADERAQEARRSADDLFSGSAELSLLVGEFRDAYFPACFAALKDHFADLRSYIDPDIVFTHCIDDRHQDHRLVAELTWQAWRDHIILEYEVPKYEGDLGRPNLFVPASRTAAQAKVSHLLKHFGSQRSKSWFSDQTFFGLMRLRGIECRSASVFAEAFVARKLLL